MDAKSANAGDRMKHALSLEVLSRTDKWPLVTYSETHAGAGLYDESKQKPAQSPIRDLWELVCSASALNSGKRLTNSPVAGTAYLELLERWWTTSESPRTYPGSARQACEYLKRSGRDFRLYLTEADDETCRKLREAVKECESAEVKCCSFEGEIEWLTTPDWLYLVVDPFRCVESFTGNNNLPDGKFGVTKGDIDHRIVRNILQRCQDKEAAVMHFWWPTTSRDAKNGVTAIITESNRTTCNLFQTWESEAKGRCYRQFDDKHNHASALLGVGSGADIVQQIGQLAWEKSWLRSYVRTKKVASHECH